MRYPLKHPLGSLQLHPATLTLLQRDAPMCSEGLVALFVITHVDTHARCLASAAVPPHAQEYSEQQLAICSATHSQDTQSASIAALPSAGLDPRTQMPSTQYHPHKKVCKGTTMIHQKVRHTLV
jgi:hypothetical protein